ncbi:MAG: aspartate/glutamate racemase family protein [Clostridia bacterium]|nr:aspartate/glutamate racemase family protein [Clostridia bacterium]
MDIPKGGVAFFDSGIGGLTVLAECQKYVKDTFFYYLGDNLRAPYGNLPKATVCSYVNEMFEKLARLQPRAVVVACNTATALCIESLRKQYAFPIIGAEPAVFTAAKNGGDIFVLSTRATYESQRFQTLCRRAELFYPNARLHLHACNRLAGEIERHLFTPEWDVAPFLPTGNPDSVVLGCTHYVFLKKQIQTFYQTAIYDGNEGIAKRLRSVLLKTPEKSNDFQGRIFFLGKAKWSNEYVYEQMFGNK